MSPASSAQGRKIQANRAPGTSGGVVGSRDRKSTRLNSSHSSISYAVFCLKKKKKNTNNLKQYSYNDNTPHKHMKSSKRSIVSILTQRRPTARSTSSQGACIRDNKRIYQHM